MAFITMLKTINKALKNNEVDCINNSYRTQITPSFTTSSFAISGSNLFSSLLFSTSHKLNTEFLIQYFCLRN